MPPPKGYHAVPAPSPPAGYHAVAPPDSQATPAQAQEQGYRMDAQGNAVPAQGNPGILDQISQSGPGQAASRWWENVRGLGHFAKSAVTDPKEFADTIMSGGGVPEALDELSSTRYQQERAGFKPGMMDELAYRALQARTAIPFLGPALYSENKAAAKSQHPFWSLFGGAAGITTAGRLAEAAGGVPKAAVESIPAFQRGLNASAHDMMTQGANRANATIWDVPHTNISRAVGNLRNAIETADAAHVKGTGQYIAVPELWPELERIGNQYRASGESTPKFNAAVEAITSRKGPYLTFDELHQFKQELWKLRQKAVDGSPDAAATTELLKAVDQKLTQRAEDIGAAKQYQAHNELWRTLMQYEDKDAALGRLLNAKNGADYFQILRDPKNINELKRVNDALAQHGLPPDFFSSLREQYKPLHEYTRRFDASGNIQAGGRYKAIIRHPVAGTIGGAVGSAAGSAGGVLGHVVGAMAGAQIGAGLVERVRAARAMSKLGGLPEPIATPEFTEATDVARRTGTVEAPPKTSSAATGIFKDVQDALISQKIPKADATRLAQKAVQANPDNFNAAFSAALKEYGGRASSVREPAVRPPANTAQGTTSQPGQESSVPAIPVKPKLKANEVARILRERQPSSSESTTGPAAQREEYAGKVAKGRAMRQAAAERQRTGNLTPREQEVARQRQETNYVGKPVSVVGANGVIVGHAFGMVKVKFPDDRVMSFQPDMIENPKQ